MPGTTVQITFSSTVGAPSAPMHVPMALCQPGEKLVQKQCSLCPAGEYNDVASNATTCKSCPIGKYSALPGAKTCDSCPPGHAAAAPGQVACLECDAGTYSNVNGTLCVLCSEGYHAPSRGSSSCTPCVSGMYQPNKGASDCRSCSSDKPESYSLEASTSCELCHPGADCDANGRYHGARPRWWAYRPLNLSNATDGGVDTLVGKLELYRECKPINGFNSSRCLGGPDSECAAGHWGPLCSLCQALHFKGPDGCYACDQSIEATVALLNGTQEGAGLGLYNWSLDRTVVPLADVRAQRVRCRHTSRAVCDARHHLDARGSLRHGVHPLPVGDDA